MSTQPYAPGLPPAVPPKKKPGIVGIIIGVALMVLGPVIGVILIVTSAVGSVGGFSSAPVFQADGSNHQVSVTAGTIMGVWIDQNATGQCEVFDSAGNDIALSTPTSGNQTLNNYDLVAVFTPSTGGTATVTCSGDTVFPYKVAPLIAVGKLAGGIVAGVLIMVFGFLAGLAVLIVTIVRRSGWNKRYGPGAPVGGYVPNPTPYAVQPASPFGQQPITYNPQPTTYGQQPPAYGQQPQTFGQQPPTYGQPPQQPYPPAGGQTPPSYQ